MVQVRNIILILTGIVILASCATVKKEETDSRDLSYLYNPLRNPMYPRYQIYNVSEDLTDLTIKFFTNDLYFSEANPEGVPRAELLIIYRLFDMSQGRIAVDTGFYNVNIRRGQGNRQYTYTIPMKATTGAMYEAELVIRDLIRDTRLHVYLPFDKTTELSSNNFKVRGHFNKIELFNPILRPNEFVNLLYRYPLDSLYIMYFEPDTASPIPPSMLLPSRSINTEPRDIVPLAYSDTLPLSFPIRGIYLCTTDTNSLEGFPFFNFGNEFPGMTEPETMIDPLIYLTNEDQISQIKNSEKLKVALDDFWFNITGNIERSRELIRIYYNRVLYANYFFTSYKEGWRTDRGMIYIIYGPPDKVYKSPGEERWGYLKKQIKKGWGIRYKIEDEYLYFNFRKRENPFTYNDYILIRSESVTSYWDEAIRSWRSGIVFRLDNPTGI